MGTTTIIICIFTFVVFFIIVIFFCPFDGRQPVPAIFGVLCFLCFIANSTPVRGCIRL
jgi:hypothetical protein